MTLLEIDPNVVKPGWTPLLIVIALACVMVVLYLSMRRQFKKINASAGPDGDATLPTQTTAEVPEASVADEQSTATTRTRSGPGRT